MNAMAKVVVSVVVVVLACSGAQVFADWPNANPTKWVQLPDEPSIPFAVRDTASVTLADDFLCQKSGPITDIHIWGAWAADRVPRVPVVPGEGQPPVFVNDPWAVTFRFAIFSDIPAGPNNRYSRPGERLWSWVAEPAEFSARKVNEDAHALFYNPPSGEIWPPHQTIWQYNFAIQQRDAFVQEEGKIYWLALQAQPLDQDAWFGWHASQAHWNDDAVWGIIDPAAGPNWSELRYPQDDRIPPNLWGDSIDLAFALTTVPEPAGIGLMLGGVLLAIRRRR